VIHFKNIVKSFGLQTVLNGVSFDVHAGEVFFIVGASGVGKSVLIKHLVGLLQPDAGEIWIDGEEISKKDEAGMFPIRMKCAMVFQQATLFDSMTCAENVALPLRKHKGLSRKESLAEARQRLGEVQLESFVDYHPPSLSDGMKKRVAIARALAVDPSYVLFDEPTTSLDPVSARRVDKLIRQLSDARGVTSIVVSHDLTSIFSIADRLVMLYKGTVRKVGTPDAFRASDDGVIQQFIHGRASGPMDL
jgi:phospholipid/cholesterol/gamma-HCH transport system ATP-binding protein